MKTNPERAEIMFDTGTKIEMTKGYKGVKGVITERTDSPYEFYVVRLDNGINIVVGPYAFTKEPDQRHENDTN